MHLIMTRSGLAFDVTCPEPMAIRIEDIAEPLSQIFFAPGRLRRAVSVAELALAIDDVLTHDLEVKDPAVRMAGLLSDAQRAYMPLLDPDHMDLWEGTQLADVGQLLRQAIVRRFAIRTAVGTSHMLLRTARLRVEASLLRDLGPATSSLVFSARGTSAPDWLSFTQPAMPMDQMCEHFLARFNHLDLARRVGNAEQATPFTTGELDRVQL